MSEKRKMVLFLEYEPCAECQNHDVIYLCHHCGRCGRKFEEGICTNLDQFPPVETDDQEGEVEKWTL